MTAETDRRALMRLPLIAAALGSLPAVAHAGAATVSGATPTGWRAPNTDDDRSHDFDWLVGAWHVEHQRLNGRLVGSTDWVPFDGTCVMSPLLAGHGNVDDNLLNRPGDNYRAVGLRCFDPKTKTWAIWWLDARTPRSLETPVIGGFENGVGVFIADDTLRDKPVKVRFRWYDITPTTAKWEQAYSGDGGATWEVNWNMQFTRTGWG
jgi:hypothetical protein